MNYNWRGSFFFIFNSHFFFVVLEFFIFFIFIFYLLFLFICFLFSLSGFFIFFFFFFPFIFLKDFCGFILILCLYLLQTHFGISSFSHPDNALEVCGLLTPLHIVPEWYWNKKWKDKENYNSKRKDLEEEDQREDERNVIL